MPNTIIDSAKMMGVGTHSPPMMLIITRWNKEFVWMREETTSEKYKAKREDIKELKKEHNILI